jgi:T6SS, Phospholipase effector Tle1-like, catalytic domain
MARNLVLCLDGTWNKPGQKDQGVETKTNVLKLFEALAVRPDQIRTYFSGVGTDPHEKVRGGVFGWGLFDQIKVAYRALREQFTPGDPIYILGFSRGAFSARSLAGMILRCGVLRKDVDDVKLPGLVADLLTTQQDDNLKIDVTDKVFAMYKHAYEEKNRPEVERFKRAYCHDTPVRLVGVWESPTSSSFRRCAGLTAVSTRSSTAFSTPI